MLVDDHLLCLGGHEDAVSGPGGGRFSMTVLSVVVGLPLSVVVS